VENNGGMGLSGKQWEETKRLWRTIQGKETQPGFTHFVLIFTVSLFTHVDSFIGREDFAVKLHATYRRVTSSGIYLGTVRALLAAYFLLSLLFYPEDGYHMFLRNPLRARARVAVYRQSVCLIDKLLRTYDQYFFQLNTCIVLM
jgi:hypothetical protein